MEAGVLIERDGVRGVGGTENVTAMTAMVATEKEAERGATGRGVAGGGS